MAQLSMQFGTFAVVVVAGMLAAASYFDLRERRIPNRLTFGGIILGLAISCLATISGTRQWATFDVVTQVRLVEAATGLAACGVVPLFLYLTNSGGAGDVKLAWAVGALLGYQVGLPAVFYAYLFAGCWALVWMTLTGRIGALLAASLRGAVNRVLPKFVSPPDPATRARFSGGIAMAPFFSVGAVLSILDQVS